MHILDDAQALRAKVIQIADGLGGICNILETESCATRLRCLVSSPDLVDEAVLKQAGALGVIRRGRDIQVVCGVSSGRLKAELEKYLQQQGDADRDRSPGVPVHKVKKSLYSPFCGQIFDITKSKDAAFSEKMMGDGYLVIPDEGIAYAPENCKVSFTFPTGQAVGLDCEDGTEMMLHIGLNTAILEGKGFKLLVNDGDFVKKGDKLLEFDIQYIKEHVKFEECLAVFTGLREDEEIVVTAEGRVNALEKIAEIISF